MCILLFLNSLILPLQLSAEGLSVKEMSMRAGDDGTDSEAKVVLPSRKDHSIGKPEILGNLNVAGNNDPASHPKDGHARESKMQNNSDFGFHDMVIKLGFHI